MKLDISIFMEHSITIRYSISVSIYCHIDMHHRFLYFSTTYIRISVVCGECSIRVFVEVIVDLEYVFTYMEYTYLYRVLLI